MAGTTSILIGLISVSLFCCGYAYNSYEESGQCNQLAQVQTAVVQILTSHYEYSKGIHKLHSLVKSLQRDISSMKSKVKTIKKKPFFPQYQLDSPEVSHNTTEFLLKFETSLSNISKALVAHKGRFRHMQKRLNGLKRTVRKTNKSVLKVEKVKTQEDMMLQDFIKKQTDINYNSQARIKRLEVMLQKAIRQATEPKTDCPMGFIHYGRSCYQFINSSYNWVQSEQNCQRLHPKAHLVAIETKDENDFILMYRKYNAASWTSSWMWTGGNDVRNAGQWTWVGSSKLITNSDWGVHHLNNNHIQDKEQNCMYIATEEVPKWAHWNCYRAQINSVCEIEL